MPAPRTFRLALLLTCLLMAGPALADLKLPQRPREEPPLRVFHARASDPACTPNCPEWLSIEGRIVPGSAGLVMTAIEALHGLKLPALLSSRGGSVGDAIAIGALIREKGLTVAVARTLVLGCPERKPDCPDGHATATVGGAVCASACPLILAGGLERVAGAAARIGVHQITSILKEPTGALGLTVTRKIYEDRNADTLVAAYLGLMGIRDPVMELLRKTPAGGLRWLSQDEIFQSRIATATLDAAEPIVMSGANGLNALKPDGSPAVVSATGRSGDDLPAKVAFAYRPGGGALELVFSGAGGPSLGVSLGGGPPLAAQPGADGKPRATISRAAFCALDPKGRIVTTAAKGGEAYVIHLADVRGLQKLFEAACP